MKKILALTSVLALAACGQDVAKQHDADFAGCERIDTNKTHLVYKCPADMERFAEVKKQAATVMFKEGGALVWEEVNADTANVYVEVVLGEAENCADNFHYRTMVKPAVDDEMYAVISCKTVAEAQAEEPKAEEAAK